MESTEELQAFARARQHLLDQLAEQRGDLDRWLAEHLGPARDLSIRDLASLAALVQIRRDTLMELVNLDDRMLEHILERRKEA
jgi:hypothetical protein